MTLYATQRSICPVGADLLSLAPADKSSLPHVRSKGAEIDSTTAETFSTGAVARMKALAQLAGLPVVPGEKQSTTIERAARRLGFGARRTRAFFYQEARRVDADEHEQARRRMAPLVERLVRDLETMRQMDAAFYGPQIDHIERLLREAGYLVRGEGRADREVR